MNLPNSISGRLVQVASALVLLTVGCGGSMDDTPVTFTEIKPLIRTSCALSSSCHGASSTYSGSLSLADTDAYCSLVGRPKGRPTAAPPRRSIRTGWSPAIRQVASLYQKLTLAPTDSGASKPLVR